MKVLLLVAALFSTMTMAAPTYNARSSTCGELKQALENYGKITIRAKNILITRHVTVAENPRCHALAYKKEARFVTEDSISCQVGFTCEEDRAARGDCYPGFDPSRCRP